jgi:hypothetical protein
VSTLSGLTICFTGKVFIDGEWALREHCDTMARARGASSKPDFSRKVSLLVHGDLASQVVTDPDRQYSKKLVRAAWERDRGYHVCVVDGDGFADLIAGHPTRCRELQRAPKDVVLVLPQPGDGVLGAPLQRKAVGQRLAGSLMIDLDDLERGSAAHEDTVAALIAHLGRQNIEARSHARNAPRFDAGWSRGDDVFIAEVKSLTGAAEDQQIRLGIGQILDYAHQLTTMRSFGRVQPVLVLEKKPSSDRWRSVAKESGILLTWGPDFPGC